MEVEVENITLSDEDQTELYDVEKSVYFRVEEIYESEGETMVALKTTGKGPELDMPVRRLEKHVKKGRIIEKEYDSEMHD